MRPFCRQPSVRAARRRTSGLALGKAALCLTLLTPLAACGTSDRMRTSSIPLDDYRVRHPILLAKDTTTLDLFPSPGGNGLDRHSAKQVAAFAQDYRQAGQGPILALVPVGSGTPDLRGSVAGIRRVLAAVGVSAPLNVGTYPARNRGLEAPVRLSFLGLKAKVADQCGQWPDDLASGATVNEWSNRPYYNFGCATQSMMAAQAADPRDLVSPRGEEPADTLIRSRAIENIRKGVDPATNWNTHNTAIAAVGGS